MIKEKDNIDFSFVPKSIPAQIQRVIPLVNPPTYGDIPYLQLHTNLLCNLFDVAAKLQGHPFSSTITYISAYANPLFSWDIPIFNIQHNSITVQCVSSFGTKLQTDARAPLHQS